MAFEMQVFLCYASRDEVFAKELKIRLRGLQRQGFFTIFDEHAISAGEEWAKEIDKYLSAAHIILLLVSQYFIDEDFCYIVEMERAIERHRREEACVIPIILRPVYWGRTPFAKLQPLPRNGIPIIDGSWFSQDHAFFEVVEGIRLAAEKVHYLKKGGGPLI